MVAKKRGLGRGLDALLGPTRAETARPAATPSAPPEGGDALRSVGVELLQRGKYQPRVDMHNESLEDLADSIRAQGVVQPILVRRAGAGNYEIIAGERRWRAAQLAGLQEVPVVVRDMDDRAAVAADEFPDHFAGLGRVAPRLVRAGAQPRGHLVPPDIAE